MINYIKTPITEIKSQIFEQKEVKLFVKREDLNHPQISGNKWWKLKYNLEEAQRLKKSVLLTFGGAYSNHIYATAAAAKELGMASIGIIRGERTEPLNTTLSFAESCSMKLHYVTREEYSKKTEPEFIQQLYQQFRDFYLIPEGGTNELAVTGCEEFGNHLLHKVEFDYLCLPVGTGGTMAGIINGLNGRRNVLGFSSLKGGEFLEYEISAYTKHTNWQLNHDYHFGGYAKTTDELKSFMIEFENEFKIPLDPVYTAKMMFGVFDLIEKNFFERGSTVLMIHTGGLQGKNFID